MATSDPKAAEPPSRICFKIQPTITQTSELMTIKVLHCHPATPNDSIDSLTVEIVRGAEYGLTLRYRLVGDMGKILIPSARPSAARDGLWRHTCFEAFAAAETPAYREFNFSPSGEWAAYAFGDYRTRMPWTIGKSPVIEASLSPHQLLLTARIAAGDLPEMADPPTLGLAAVVESSGGNLSYWALHHSGERPDFHDRAGFAYPLDPIPSDNPIN